MPAPSSTDELLQLVSKSDLVTPERLEEFIARRRADNTIPSDLIKLAQVLIIDGLLTKYQAEQLLSGRWRNFIIGGKYKLLERLGQGGMALVFLCEHQVMKRLVALKILPSAHAADKELLGRFHREARALSQLRHPNIVGAYDADQANKVHFLVMEYVDGGDLDQLVQKMGPLSWERAANYMMQAAHGLQHAHDCGLVHRDIKPGNVLVDRSGTVKLLDLGLARIFHETTDDLTTGRDARTLLGTVDYLAPEQALNSHEVDIRADIYSLGATFYYVLTGRGLFEDGTVAQKLSWHLHRPPMPIAELRPDVPEGLVEVIEIMLSKHPDDRYQTPDEVIEALEPWTQEPIDPPGPDDFPLMSRAARSVGPPSSMRMFVPPSKVNLSNSSKTTDKNSKSSKFPKPDSGTKKSRVASTSDDPLDVPEESPDSYPPRGGRSSVQELTTPIWKKPIFLAAAAAVLMAAAAGFWFAFSGSGSGTGGGVGGVEPGPPKKLPGVEVVVTPPPPTTPSIPAPAVVPLPEKTSDVSISLSSGNLTPRPFPTLKEAIHAAKPGDRVLVQGTLMIEAIELSDVDGAPKDLTIEGINPRSKGQPVRWRAPKDISLGRALIDISGLDGLKLKGFLFDGQGRVAELVRLSGRGSGSTLEDLQFDGSTRGDIVLRGWAGGPLRPATIQNVRFTTSNDSEGALIFETDPDRPTVPSELIRVVSCRFVGPYRSVFLIGAAINGLEVEQCRFFKATDGFRYRRTEIRHPLKLKLANNTFVDLERGLHFETTPPAATSELVVTSNIFAGTPRIAMLDKVPTQPQRFAGKWIWTDEAKKPGSVPPGVRLFRKTFNVASVPEKAMLDISCDETFTVWVNGIEVFKNPSPHYTQRVFSFDISKDLKKGLNVLAVQGTNRLDRLDDKFGTAAGLYAQVTFLQGGRESVLAKSDESWKCSEVATEGWNKPEFDDKSWTATRQWADDGASWPWKYAVWDSTVLPQLKLPLEPITIATKSGNIRDYKSYEGYPLTDSERGVIGETVFGKNPNDDVTFLRYPNSSALMSAGPGGAPVGVFEEK